MNTLPSNAGYAAEAEACLVRYEARSSAEIHSDWLHLFPEIPCKVLDIGAGTGRDAAWLASMGHEVVAVEPTEELRIPAQTLHPEANIIWVDDILPDLETVRSRSETYDLILMNAVWMHLTEDERIRGMKVVSELMAPGARWFLTLRHGPVPEGRRMFNVTGDETAKLAQQAGLSCIYNSHSDAIQPENKARGINWTKVVLERNRGEMT